MNSNVTATPVVDDVRMVCPGCGPTVAGIRLITDEYRILECPACGVAVTDPPAYVSSASYDASPNLAAGYVAVESLGRHYARQMLSWLSPYCGAGRLLDVGCSIGVLVDEAAKLGFQVQGIDLDRNAIAYGKGKGRPLHQCAIEDWPEGDYDALCLMHTLEHLSDPVKFLTDCVRKLRTGGILIAAVPCHCGLHPRLFDRRWYGWQPKQHYLHYSRVGLSKVFATAGLRPIKSWQNSMDHIPRRKHICGIKSLVLSLAGFCVATFGGWIGQGDQLIVVGVKTCA